MNKVIKILFTPPVARLEGKEVGLLLTLFIGSIGFPLFFLSQEFIVLGQPRWFSSIFLLVYNILLIFSNSYFAYKLSKKKAKANLLIAGICLFLLAIENVIFYYLYSSQVFASRSSLFIIVPVSWSVMFICVKIWMFISNKKTMNLKD